MVKKERSSNFELMRIVSMLFIVCNHVIIHGHFIEECLRPSMTVLFNILNCMFIVHVNSFVLLMGYFQVNSKFKLSKLLKLILQVIFYSMLCLILGISFGWVKEYDVTTFITRLLPSIISDYWFINMYIIIYIFSDYINKFINRLTRQEHKQLIIISFVVLSILPYISGLKFYNNDGYNVINFLFLYLIGAYIRLYGLRNNYHFKSMSLNGYKLLMIFGFCFMFMLNYFIMLFGNSINGLSNIFDMISTNITNNLYSYAAPFVVLQSVCYFELFNHSKIKQSKIINFVASCTFGIYLFHGGTIMRNNIYKFLLIDTGPFISYKKMIILLVGTLIIFIVGFVVECLRKLLIYIIKKSKLYIIVRNKLLNIINSFNYKINW